jgi:hypothetical protein
MVILDAIGGMVIAIIISLGVSKALELIRTRINPNEEKKD